MTVDWLAKVLHRALGPLAVPGRDGQPAPWESLAPGDQECYRLALTATLVALDDPCLLNLHEGEPIFVMRAAKVFAFAEWQRAHADLVKVPD
jgi:hypothetical protein